MARKTSQIQLIQVCLHITNKSKLNYVISDRNNSIEFMLLKILVKNIGIKVCLYVGSTDTQFRQSNCGFKQLQDR